MRQHLAIPDWLMEMSQQMRDQPSRATSHPFWQVRCKRTLPTARGYNDHGYEIISSECGVIYKSSDPSSTLIDYLLENHGEWCAQWAESIGEEDAETAMDFFDPESDSLPDSLDLVYVQEVEEVISTHFTQSDAERFIQRKQHDYPPLYTYVESAYWSPQLRQLQDWIISLSEEQPREET